LAFHQAGNNTSSTSQALPKVRLYKACMCCYRACSPMPFAILRVQEVPSRAWALSPRRSIAEFGLNPERKEINNLTVKYENAYGKDIASINNSNPVKIGQFKC